MHRQQVEERGFAVMPGIFEEDRVTLLAENLAAAKLRRSRAGVRHALGYAAVASLANDPQLLEIARHILGMKAYPSGQPCSRRRRMLIGLWSGIKTQHSRYAVGRRRRVGDRGLLKRA